MSSHLKLKFNVTSLSSEYRRIEFTPRHLIIAGWTGSNAEAVEKHIKELEEIGVARPRQTPTFYRLSTNLVSQDGCMDVVGGGATGEAEVILLKHDGEFYVGVGSDHTDRHLETFGVTYSKQICAKPIGSEIWPLAEVRGHWDRLVLRSRVWRNEDWETYQEGSLDSLLSPDALLAQFADQNSEFEDTDVMFCGTIPIIGEFYFSEKMTIELADTVLNRNLQHEFKVNALQIAD